MKPEDFEIFSTLVRQRSGMALPPEKAYLLESRLDGVARKHSLKSLEDLANALRSKREDNLISDIAEAMTNNETWFFRDRAVFQAIGQTVLPRLIQLRGDEKRLRMLSAATASGQEAYSLVMLCAEAAGSIAGWTTEIIATDLSRASIAKAKSGTYTQFEVQRGLPIRFLVKYFSQLSGDKWQISDRLRQAIAFQEGNLFAMTADEAGYDLICCRYVLDNFDDQGRAFILDCFGSMMRPGSFLILSPDDMRAGHRLFTAHETMPGGWVRNGTAAAA